MVPPGQKVATWTEVAESKQSATNRQTTITTSKKPKSCFREKLVICVFPFLNDRREMGQRFEQMWSIPTISWSFSYRVLARNCLLLKQHDGMDNNADRSSFYAVPFPQEPVETALLECWETGDAQRDQVLCHALLGCSSQIIGSASLFYACLSPF